MKKIRETKKYFDIMGYDENSADFKEKLALVQKIVDARFVEDEIDVAKVEDFARRLTLEENVGLIKKLKALEEYFIERKCTNTAVTAESVEKSREERIAESEELGNMLEIEGEIYDMIKSE